MADSFKQVKRIIGAIEIFGGISGLVLTVGKLFIGDFSAAGAIFALLFIALFCLSIVAGVLLIEGSGKGLKLSLWTQGLQIPYLASPLISYFYASGIYLLLYIGQSSGVNFEIHSAWLMSIGNSGFSIGLNVFPVIFLIVLFKMSKAEKESQG
ncbi:MAG: hypothetical protein ACYCSW_05380 [bacterium]